MSDECEVEVIQETPFVPDKVDEGISKHVWRSLWQYPASVLFFWAIGFWVLDNYKTLSPDDPDVLWRWLSEGYVHIAYALGIITGVVCAIQLVTNGNLIGRMLSDAQSCAIAFGVIVLGVVVLLVGC
jgi:hypothetical protein